MKKLLSILTVIVLAVACRTQGTDAWEPIPYVRELAVDTSGTFNLLQSYRTAGAEGTIALIGEPEACLPLSAGFLAEDRRDNIDAKPSLDRLPDFAGETFDVILDLYNAPYRRMAVVTPDHPDRSDSLREITVRNAVMALDTIAYSNALDKQSRIRKNGAKVFVLASTVLEGYGLRDLDTLFRMASREPLIITPARSMLAVADREGCRRVAVWAPEEVAQVYRDAAAETVPGMDVTVVSAPVGGDVRLGFREMLRRYRAESAQGVLDAVLLDSQSADVRELEAELEHIHRQITEEDMAFDRILSPNFHFIETRTSLMDACYRLLREKNLFTHNIAYPSARYFQTEENPDGDYVLVEVKYDYLTSLPSFAFHVSDHD